MANGNQAKAIGDISILVAGLAKDFAYESKNQAEFKTDVKDSLRNMEANMTSLENKVEALQQAMAKSQGQQSVAAFTISAAINVFFLIVNLIQRK